jgi:hypothetical protein
MTVSRRLFRQKAMVLPITPSITMPVAMTPISLAVPIAPARVVNTDHGAPGDNDDGAAIDTTETLRSAMKSNTAALPRVGR